MHLNFRIERQDSFFFIMSLGLSEPLLGDISTGARDLSQLCFQKKTKRPGKNWLELLKITVII